MQTVQEAMKIAIECHQAGRLPEAEALYRQVLAQDPDNPDALHLLGVAVHQLGNHQNAAALILKAIEINPQVADYHCNLGEAFAALGRFDQAIRCYQKAIALEPNYPTAYYNLGNVLGQQDLLDESVTAYRKAIELNPGFCEALNNLGNVLRDVGRTEEAVAAYRKAIELRPDAPEPWCNLAIALHQARLLNEALAAFEKAIQLRPDYAEAHWSRALLLLQAGRFAEGWPEFEWRWRVRDLPMSRPGFPQPEWTGAAPNGRTILLYTEQGLGDILQFIRYAPLLAERGARVIVACQAEVKSLLQNMKEIEEVLAGGEPLLPFDMHSALMSLPLAFGTTIETIPASVPYLRPDPALVELWRGRLAPRSTVFLSHGPASRPALRPAVRPADAARTLLHAPRLKIGLAWAGRPKHRNDRQRSMPLSALAPLAHVQGVSFYSLQKGEAAAQAGAPPPGMVLTDLTAELKDFADTAALIAHLDLVISVDTAVAHLAGAMAKPVWVLLPFVPDWRWLLEREDSPWYPTMRLFRQPAPGNWHSVVQRIAQELRSLCAEKAN